MIRLCEVIGCGRPRSGKTWCKTHYNRVKAGEDPSALGPINHQRKTLKGGRDNRDKTLWQYRLTVQEYEAILMNQNGLCAICKTNEPGGRWNIWNVDHDHKCCPGKKSCGKCVRGLLCQTCNVILGMLEDQNLDPKLYAVSINRYLEGFLN